jgi:hypothetical protein
MLYTVEQLPYGVQRSSSAAALGLRQVVEGGAVDGHRLADGHKTEVAVIAAARFSDVYALSRLSTAMSVTGETTSRGRRVRGRVVRS